MLLQTLRIMVITKEVVVLALAVADLAREEVVLANLNVIFVTNLDMMPLSVITDIRIPMLLRSHFIELPSILSC